MLAVETYCENCARPVQCNMPKSKGLAVVVWVCKVCRCPNITAWNVPRDCEAGAELGRFSP